MGKKYDDTKRQLRIARGTVIGIVFLTFGVLTAMATAIALITTHAEQAMVLMAGASGLSVGGITMLLTIHAKVLGINDTYRAREAERIKLAENASTAMTMLLLNEIRSNRKNNTAESEKEDDKRYDKIIAKIEKICLPESFPEGE